MSDLARAMTRLAPDAVWAVRGDVLFWDDDAPQPSQADIDAAVLEVAWSDVRVERDRLLAGSDWTQVSDAPVDAAAWAVYRQQLRDVPQDFGSPDEVVWPIPPV